MGADFFRVAVGLLGTLPPASARLAGTVEAMRPPPPFPESLDERTISRWWWWYGSPGDGFMPPVVADPDGVTLPGR